jgi:hypothetical protein
LSAPRKGTADALEKAFFHPGRLPVYKVWGKEKPEGGEALFGKAKGWWGNRMFHRAKDTEF